MELQDKLEKREKLLAVKGSQEKEDLISALMNLGFRRKEVERVVDETIKTLTVEAGFEKLLRESLKKMSRI
jgi:Holliday junction DNA helicase RuvA